MAQSNKPPKSNRQTEQSGKGGPFIKKATPGRPVSGLLFHSMKMARDLNQTDSFSEA
ncbi:MAG: hypothetical protein NPIRA06_14860 [Nitrospirales bacterium]|nr:MAG: hypothetical protein NPIRA06_14860 [Nitrospirales bacterium]